VSLAARLLAPAIPRGGVLDGHRRESHLPDIFRAPTPGCLVRSQNRQRSPAFKTGFTTTACGRKKAKG
jgi:hypothetical protein